MSERPDLRALAARLGVLDGYHSALDGSWVETLDSTREALCTSMGCAADTEASAAASLDALEAESQDAESAGAHEGSERAFSVDELLGGEGRAFGVWANLYSIRSRRNQGFGDFGDLVELVHQVGREGGAFVGLNPLHALGQDAGDPCPYRPSSRLFREPLYLAIDAVPELTHRESVRRLVDLRTDSNGAWAPRRGLRLDVAALRREQRPVLQHLFDCFGERRRLALDEARCHEFQEYCTEEGRALQDFATFCALTEALGDRDWRRWPVSHRNPRSPAVKAFRESHSAEIEFHAWLQFELDRQLKWAADEAERVGLALGLYSDLALGGDPAGSDAWAFADCFASGVNLGAPPDDFSREGQDWSIPPMIPRSLQACGYEPWRLMLRAGFRHSAALRIDHALGLRRQFWIPEGRSAREGAYVMQPERDLLDVVITESRRSKSIVVAEDLGTVPPGFSESLVERGLLSSRVLLFERTEDGFLPGSAYPRACLATVNTHDLPPLEAFFSDSDLALRRDSGQIPDDAALEELRARRIADRSALHQRLAEDRLVAGEPTEDDIAAGATRFLCESPAALVGLGLDDLAGESEPINLPGVAPDRHPSWTRKMSVSLEDIPACARARSIFSAIPEQRRTRR